MVKLSLRSRITKPKPSGWDSKRRLMPVEADMYQMHAYASAFQCRELALIYPWRSELARSTGARFRLPML